MTSRSSPARAASTRSTAARPPRRPHSTDEPGFAAKSAAGARPRRTPSPGPPPLVRPGSAVGLSAGTTTWTLARQLLDVPDLTVVTNSVQVADVSPRVGAHRTRPSCSPAGCARRRTRSSGRSPSRRCDRCTSTCVFLGVHGMDERDRLHHAPTCWRPRPTARSSQSARRLVVLADHTKWGVVGISTIADPRRGRRPHQRHGCWTPSAEAVLREQVGEVAAGREPSLTLAGDRREAHVHQLADGRELIYFDDAATRHHGRNGDRRPAHLEPTATSRRDAPRRRRWTSGWRSPRTGRAARTCRRPTSARCARRAPAGRPRSRPPTTTWSSSRTGSRPSLRADADPGSDEPRRRPGRGRCEVVCFTSDHDAVVRQPCAASGSGWCWTPGPTAPRSCARCPGWRRSSASRTAARRSASPWATRTARSTPTRSCTPRRGTMLEAARRHRERTGRLLVADVLAAELTDGGGWWQQRALDGVRAVRRPLAGRGAPRPAPRRAGPAALDDAERDEFAAVYLDVLGRMDRLYDGDPRCRTSRPGTRRRPGPTATCPHLHLQVFSIRRAPDKLKYLAGSESGMGVLVNDTRPERDRGPTAGARLQGARLTGSTEQVDRLGVGYRQERCAARPRTNIDEHLPARGTLIRSCRVSTVSSGSTQHRPLVDDRAGVEHRVDPVAGAPGDLRPRGPWRREHRCWHPGEAGQQGGVGVDHPGAPRARRGRAPS